MKRIWILFLLLPIIVLPCKAMEYSAPPVPDAGSKYMPDETESFGEGLHYVISTALMNLHPALSEAMGTCAVLAAVALLVGTLNAISLQNNMAVEMIGLTLVAIILLRPANSMIKLGTETIIEICQYGKLLLPVMTGALAAQGAITRSGALYAATVFFDTLLSELITDCLIPFVYLFLCICAVNRLANLPLLSQIKRSLKGFMSWGLKVILYVFTGYISITGVVSGSTDAAMLKATKLTISSMVPVVGGILSDTSEALLVSAELVKNAAGIYGLLAMIAIGIGPFLRIGVQYILLKFSVGICDTFVGAKISGLVKDFSETMGLVLAMLGTVSMVQLISTICFLRGIT